jgi:hypothetical protein
MILLNGRSGENVGALVRRVGSWWFRWFVARSEELGDGSV